MDFMTQSAISTLRHRAIMAMREAGKPWMSLRELAERLCINRPDFENALVEAGFTIITV
jgi:hypothetical protein